MRDSSAIIDTWSEQLLPLLLRRAEVRDAIALDYSKDDLAEELRPVISEVLNACGVALTRREQFAVEKLVVDRLPALALGKNPFDDEATAERELSTEEFGAAVEAILDPNSTASDLRQYLPLTIGGITVVADLPDEPEV